MGLSPTQVRQELQWRRWRSNARSFIESCVYIQHPRGRRLIELRSAQAETLAAIQDHSKVIILKARQIGFTTLMAAYALWLAMFFEDQKIILLSRTERDAQDFLRKIKFAYDRLPDWVVARAPSLKADTLQKMEFANGSVIESLPSKENPARGRTVTLVIVDEWAFLENPEEAWASILPIADLGGSIIGLGTANGFGNFFHKLWQGARNRTNGFWPIFYSWRAIPERNDDWYQSMRSSFTNEWQIHQEFPSDEDEAFIKSGRTVFDIDLLQKMETREPMVGSLWHREGRREYRQSDGGELSVWEMPQANHRYAIGVDVAEGLEHGDWSAAHVIDTRAGTVVAAWHGHVDPDLLGEELNELGRWYNTALVVVEVNASGLSVCKALQRLSYPRLYYRRILDDRTKKQTTKVGWRTTRSSKPLMIDDLSAALRNGELVLWDEPTVVELKGFVRDEKGGMGGSPHDDRVISLALAQQGRQHVWSGEFESKHGPAPGTWDYEVAPLLNKSKSQLVLGGHSVRSRP